MSRNSSPIGLIDSGVGGLTAAKELRTILPNENIIYCADSANVPYGNRAQDEIISLTKRMLEFLEKRQVKLVLLACNTISVLNDRFCELYPYPILDIISPMAKAVSDLGIESVGLVATKFTVESGMYEALLRERQPDMKVFGYGSKDLAMMIDSGDLASKAIYDEVGQIVQALTAQPISHIILGCTHYPIVTDVFVKAAPHINFLNPAVFQTEKAKLMLQSEDLLNEQEASGSMTVYTTGEKETCGSMLTHLGFKDFALHQIDKF